MAPNPGSRDDQQRIKSSKPAVAEFTVTFDDGPQGPVPDVKGLAGSCVFFVQQLDTTPTVVLEFTFKSGGDPRQAKTRLEFAFNKANTIPNELSRKLENRLFVRQEIADFDMTPTSDGAELSFKSQGGRIYDVFYFTESDRNSGQVILRSRPKQEQKWVLDIMKKVAMLDPDKICTIRIKLTDCFYINLEKKRIEKSDVIQIADLLPSKSRGRTIPHFEDPAIDYLGSLNLRSRQTPLKARILRSPISNTRPHVEISFRDHDEAAIHLSIGFDLLNKEKKMYLNAVVKDLHNVSLLSAGNYVFAIIDFSKALASDIQDMEAEEKVLIPNNTMVELVITAGPECMRDWTAIGVVTLDNYEFHCDLLVRITKKDGSEFSSILNTYATRPEDVRPLKVRIKPIVSDTTTRLAMNAVASNLNITYKRDNPDFVPAMFKWPIIYQGERLPDKESFNSRNSDAVQVALTKLCEAESWNDSQRDALSRVSRPMAGIQIIEGAIGTGKSLMIAHIAQMAISLSSKVMVLGNMNESLDFVFLKILDVLSPSSTTKCVRVYPATSESPMLRKPKRTAPDPALDDEIAVKLFAAERVRRYL